MKRASYKKDFQSWKGIMALKLLCCNIVAGRFDWKKYCTPQSYCGQEICVVPLHCSYGQIGYTVHFPYSDIPEVEYDWEMNKLTIDKGSSSDSNARITETHTIQKSEKLQSEASMAL